MSTPHDVPTHMLDNPDQYITRVGKFLRKRVNILERFCIPAPVIGGVVFAVLTCVCYVTGIAEFSFDDILKEYLYLKHIYEKSKHI